MRSLILIFISVFTLSANGLHYEHDFGQALQKAKQQHKEVMMMYSAVWCPECNYMKEVVFKDKHVADYVQKHYVVLMLDIQKDTLPEGFEYEGIPTFFFIDKSAKEKGRIIGGSKADIFLKKLKAVQ